MLFESIELPICSLAARLARSCTKLQDYSSQSPHSYCKILDNIESRPYRLQNLHFYKLAAHAESFARKLQNLHFYIVAPNLPHTPHTAPMPLYIVA